MEYHTISRNSPLDKLFPHPETATLNLYGRNNTIDSISFYGKTIFSIDHGSMMAISRQARNLKLHCNINEMNIANRSENLGSIWSMSIKS